MLEELIENFAVTSKKYIGGLVGFAFGYVFIAYGFGPMLIVSITTGLGFFLGSGINMKRVKKIIVDRLKDE